LFGVVAGVNVTKFSYLPNFSILLFSSFLGVLPLTLYPFCASRHAILTGRRKWSVRESASIQALDLSSRCKATPTIHRYRGILLALPDVLLFVA